MPFQVSVFVPALRWPVITAMVVVVVRSTMPVLLLMACTLLLLSTVNWLPGAAMTTRTFELAVIV